MKTTAVTFENLQLLSGIKGMKNLAVAKGINYGAKKIKNKFGLDMTFTNYSQIRAVTEWIRERDPKFKDHISNPFSLNEKVSDELLGSLLLNLIERHIYSASQM